MKEDSKSLKKRVEKVKSKLSSLGFKNSKNDFNVKYPEFNDEERLNNLWYCKVSDKEFTIKLEAFLTFKETYYK